MFPVRKKLKVTVYPGKAPCKWSVGGPLAGGYFRNLIVPSPHDPGSIKHPQPSTVQMPSPDFWQNPFEVRHIPGLGYPDTLKGSGIYGQKYEISYCYEIVIGVGWGGRIRTYGTRYQKALPYRLATPQL